MCPGNQVVTMYRNGVVMVPDAADGSSSLGTENWLLDLAMGRKWVTGWLNKSRFRGSMGFS